MTKKKPAPAPAPEFKLEAVFAVELRRVGGGHRDDEPVVSRILQAGHGTNSEAMRDAATFHIKARLAAAGIAPLALDFFDWSNVFARNGDGDWDLAAQPATKEERAAAIKARTFVPEDAVEQREVYGDR